MKFKNLSHTPRIGILGGGQLARMSAYAAYQLGFEVVIWETTPASPAANITKHDFAGSILDDTLLRRFADACDVITLENEFIDAERLHFLESLGKKVFPSSKTIGLIQDKFVQKRTLARKGIPVPKFMEIKGAGDYLRAAKQVGLPFLLKSRKMGYDGYGNATVFTQKDFSDTIARLQERHSALMGESFVNFKKELAIMVVRTKKETCVYPVVESIQENHICKKVIAPAAITPAIAASATDIAVAAVEAVNGYGIFGIELFLTQNGELLLNEMAPRPHNTGHYTIDACVTSQFENHIRSVLDLPLGSCGMTHKSAVMINLLGKRNGAGIPTNYHEALADPGTHLHVYGKSSSRPGRKMGHITVTGKSRDNCMMKAENAAAITDL
ncbi:5-(carboxyamino)imidazole ribonucleotide synthase [Candidatus Brocadiaceae bacterium]|nr:5-(carboxyamino)imidazole ribonucleotide synthase [Candidatus Brocadiaceae bacterium]